MIFTANHTQLQQLEAAILAACEAHDLNYKSGLLIGESSRLDVSGDQSDTGNGWIFLFPDGLGGVIQNWKTDDKPTAFFIGGKQRELTPEERARIEHQRDAQRLALETKHMITAAHCAGVWVNLKEASQDHAYLVRKGVSAHGLKSDGRKLVLPVYDFTGKIWSLQSISHDGSKRFETGGRTKGNFFLMRGFDLQTSPLLICEGFATGASLFEATSNTTLCALSAANMVDVALEIKRQFPARQIIICGDNGEMGRKYAFKAATAVQAHVVFPDGAGDFNDLHAESGYEAVRSAISRAQTPPPPETVPGLEERPCYRVFTDWVSDSAEKYKPGVYKFSVKDTVDGPSFQHQYICSPLFVEAISDNGQGGNFGRVIRFADSHGKWRTWSMPMEMIAGTGEAMRSELLAMGAVIAPSAHRSFSEYIAAQHPKRTIRSVSQTGWHGPAFVLPRQVIGQGAHDIILQTGERVSAEYGKTGSFEVWRSEIATGTNNHMLVFALSVAFAGPLLLRTGTDGGGFHLVGNSSCGKTTLLRAACSVWGGKGFMQSWKSTGNGMEGVAVLHNDTLLALDEISECDPRFVGDITYALANGRGKQRANRFGTARDTNKWRLMVLSTGERRITTSMEAGGHSAKAGQTVRLLDLPVERKFGVWDKLPQNGNAAAFSDQIKQVASANYGHAGPAFLKQLVKETRNLQALLSEIAAREAFKADDALSKRAAMRFALAGLAGELAAQYRVTAWPPDTAILAAETTFKTWREGQRIDASGDTKAHETRAIARQVREFIERFGSSRFSDRKDPSTRIVINDRAGWFEDVGNQRWWLFTAPGLRAATSGYDFDAAIKALKEIGYLIITSEDKKSSKAYRIDGQSMRCYAIKIDD